MFFAFELGREFRLSLSEIYSLFPNGNFVFCDQKIAILSNISIEEVEKKAFCMGGTIKIIGVEPTAGSIEEILIHGMSFENHEGKYHYAINVYGKSEIQSKNILKISKKIVKEAGFNPRFVNTKFQNISSATIFHEKLVSKGTDFNIIFTQDQTFFGKTVWVQDIQEYTKRDVSKSRDMKIGMLPPKLAQIMINISKNISNRDWEKTILYDPFVGLGTLLIEAKIMGYQKIYGSDISERMVCISTKNISEIPTYSQVNVFLQNAKYIHEVTLLNQINTIVTEGYLGEVMTQQNINFERIQKQKEKLLEMYEGFFSGLKKGNFNGNIVITFPFWEIKGVYVYFEEMYTLIEKYTFQIALLPDSIPFGVTKSKSLLYKRPNQLVGREIFHLQMR